MDISNYNIEQCDAPSVLAAVLDAHDHPQKIDQIAAAISPIAKELSDGKASIIAALRNRGANVNGNESLGQLADMIRKSLALLPMGTQFISTPICFGDPLLSNNVKVLYTTLSDLSSRILCNEYYSLGGYLSRCEGLIAPNLNVTQYNAVGMNGLKFIEVPKHTTVSFQGNLKLTAPNVRKAILGAKVFNGLLGYNANLDYLYYLEYVNDFAMSISFSLWTASEALALTQTLVEKNYWDDQNEPTFANNREKFLWYFEYHFIPCFATMDSSPTVTFSSAVFNVISSAISQETPSKTLKQLIEDKGWTVASA